MKEFFSSKKFKAILCILAVLLGFMVQAAYTGNLSSVASQALGFITAPIQSVATGVSDMVGGFFDRLQSTDKLMEEIEQLKEENRKLKSDLTDLNHYREENAAFKEALGIQEENPTYETVVCRVVGRDPADRYYSFTLDKGSLDGIKLYDMVVTADGLAGMIMDVGPNYSVVMTILDPGFVVGCYSNISRDTGSLTGDNRLFADGCTKLQYISMESTMQAGDLILTSGGKSSMAPQDIVVGTVKEVRPEDHGISKYAEIEPAVDVSRVSTVIVITDY